MTESLCTNAIHEAILTFDRNHAGSWCSPLVDALESLSAGSSIEWCVEVLAQTLGRSAQADDARTLVTLRQLVDQKSSAIELAQKSREIWYSCELRGAFQTATSKAYEAVAAYVGGDVRRYKRGIALTVSEIALAGMTSSSDPRMQQILQTFKSRCAQFESSSRGENEDD